MYASHGRRVSLLVAAMTVLTLLYLPAVARAVPKNVTMCTSTQDGGWTTTSADFEVIRSCTFDAPQAGKVLAVATTSYGVSTGGNYEMRLNLNLDSTAGNTNTDRWVNAYTDSTDGSDGSAAVQYEFPVSPGSHTVNFLGARYNGAGTVQLYDPTLTLVFVPDGTPYQTCSSAGHLVWNTSETSFQEVRKCSMTVTEPSTVLMIGTSSAGLASGGQPYEMRYRLGVDAVTGTAATDRWVNVVSDAGDGADEAVGVSHAQTVTAGAHDFYFSATRYNGPGPVQLYDPALTVMAFPVAAAPANRVTICESGGSDFWTNSTTSYSTIRQCTLDAPAGQGFMLGTASAGLNDTAAGNDWEGQFRLGIDSDTGSPLSDRWVNVYTDAADGTDTPLLVSLGVPLAAGARTAYFVGRRYAGNGTLRLYSPSLAMVRIPAPDLTAPAVTITGLPDSETTATTADLGWTSDDPDAAVECAVDDGAFAACPVTTALTGLAVGPHRFRLRAVDGVGNESAVVEGAWTVTAPPASSPGPATPEPSPAGPPTPPDAPLLACEGVEVRLTAVSPSGRRVRVAGLALRRYAGQRVTIKLGAKVVAATTAAADGTFAVRVPKPAKPRTARYTATVGTSTSVGLRLERRLLIGKPTTSADRVRVSGRLVSGKRSRRTLTVRRQTGCNKTVDAGTVKTDRRGRFTVKLPRPAAGSGVSSYRIAVRGKGKTVSLPVLVSG